MAKAVVVISYDLPEDLDEGFEKLQEIASTIRHLFQDKPDVEIRVAIQDYADAIINFFKENERDFERRVEKGPP